MRICIANRVRNTTNLFATSCRSHTNVAKDAATTAESLAPKVANDIAHSSEIWPQTQTEDVEKPPRPRRRPLPLSPLMDPVYKAAKQKYQQPKAPPSKNPTPFQRQLQKCPYGIQFLPSKEPESPAQLIVVTAQALATPIRMCALTKARLPSYFLQDFAALEHPETKEPWYLPRSLTSAYSASASLQPADVQPRGTSVGGKYYTLARYALLQGAVTKRSGIPPPPMRFTRARQHELKVWPKNIKWRDDMHTFVLELMRRRVVENLEYLCTRRRGYVVKTESWDEARKKKQIGAFLWIGKGDIDQADGGSEDAAAVTSTMLEPGEFATLDIKTGNKTKLPVHNLQVLLGQEHVKALREKYSNVFNAEIVVVKDKKATADIILRLWKLQGFLAKYEGMEESHHKIKKVE
jgi:hypothetical protein